jgi:ubiquitin-protein ligase E3 C
MVLAPLRQSQNEQDSTDSQLATYSSFAFSILTIPDLEGRLGCLTDVAYTVRIGMLSRALLEDKSIDTLSSMDPDARLWLLSHFIYLHSLQHAANEEGQYIRALSTILSMSANDVYGRIEVDEDPVEDDIDDASQALKPLPEFMKSQLVSLVNKESITSLLAEFNTDYLHRGRDTGAEANLLPSYALTLLRTFPTLSEEIRMWLYQSSVTASGFSEPIPAVKLFWNIMLQTSTFNAISRDANAALDILRKATDKKPSPFSNGRDLVKSEDWRAILLFLELYAFVLRFTDDEEFLSGGQQSVTSASEALSRSRESALPLRDVKALTIFLKNLAFTMYFYGAELSKASTEEAVREPLSLYGLSEQKLNAQVRPTETTEHFLGIAGMTFEYVRNIVSRVMRMLYERDSRRRFLPVDHWLMTSKISLDGFTEAVVLEEERRQQLADEEEDEEPEVQMTGAGAFRPDSRLRGMPTLSNRLASVGPRLEILHNMPFAIPFKTRVEIFRQFVLRDQAKRRDGVTDPDLWRMTRHPFQGGDLSRHHARIRRHKIFEDAFKQFYPLGEGLKEPIQITFVDKFDTVEAGIDGGGVTKEFLTSITNEAFRPEGSNRLHFFVANSQNLLYPNPVVFEQVQQACLSDGATTDEIMKAAVGLKQDYEFLGRIVGKCLYEGILLDVGFAPFFLLKWASSARSSVESQFQADINDLRDLDEDLYQGLLKLKNYPGDVEDFGLDFTITNDYALPGQPSMAVTVDLISGGSQRAVTNENRILYISAVARHRLHVQGRLQTYSFLKGLGQMISPSWLSMFNQNELQTLVGGDVSEIDIDDLRRNTIYSGVYVIGDDQLEHPTIQLFWQVMKELEDEDRRKVLKYVTSTPRAPLLGFSQLIPKFSIRDAGGDEQRLPSTSTCINLLKLPRYTTKKTMKDKLLYAVNSGAGFDLS